jgi:hypothetical protein
MGNECWLRRRDSVDKAGRANDQISNVTANFNTANYPEYLPEITNVVEAVA